MPAIRNQNSDWRLVTLNDVIERHVERREALEHNTPFVGVDHLDSGELLLRRHGVIGVDEIPPTFRFAFHPGMMLVPTRRPRLRKCAIAPFSGLTGEKVLVLKVKDAQLLHPLFAPFLVSSPAVQEWNINKEVGSVTPHFRWGDMAECRLWLPPLDKQERAADVLRLTDEALHATAEVAKRAELLRKSYLCELFESLLTDPRAAKESAGNVGDIQIGRQRAPMHDAGPNPRPYLRVANVYDGYIDTTDVLTMNFSDAEFERYRLRDGDILLNEGQSRELVGRSSIFRGEVADCCFQNTLIRFRSRAVSPEFAHAYFQFCLYTGRFAGLASQTTSIAHLGSLRFSSMIVPVPSSAKQVEVVETVMALKSACDAAARRVLLVREQREQLLGTVLEREGLNGELHRI